VAGKVTPAIASWEQAQAFSQAACRADTLLDVHIKIDTGMGRLGFLASPRGFPERDLSEWDSSEQDFSQSVTQLAQLIGRISRLPGIRIEGLYTHLADADEEGSIADIQWQLFERVQAALLRQAVNIPVGHVANSAGILRWAGREDRRSAYSRPGIVLYGISPSSDPLPPAGFRPVLSFRARITHLKLLPAGHSVSYNRTYIAPGPTRMAVLPLGYADGVRRELSNRGQVLIRGRRAPIIGRVCMDQTMVDVTGIPDVALGDEAVLIGRQTDLDLSAHACGEEITAGEVAGWCRTIPYEIVCGISKRVPRMYRGTQQPD
jgi:alanine racemase